MVAVGGEQEGSRMVEEPGASRTLLKAVGAQVGGV